MRSPFHESKIYRSDDPQLFIDLEGYTVFKILCKCGKKTNLLTYEGLFIVFNTTLTSLRIVMIIVMGSSNWVVQKTEMKKTLT